MLSRPRRLIIGALLVAVLTGCADNAEPAPRNAEPASRLQLPWRAVSPPGTVTDLAACDGRWLAVGAAGGRPGAWTSMDGLAWQAVSLRASTLYGEQGAFTSVACRGADVVAIARASGGAHGNPRITTWRSAPAGWHEVQTPFDLFHGPTAGSVDRVVAGPAGWLIVGHRVSPTTRRHGAAVWVSTDGTAFRLVDDDPALRSAGSGYTSAYDAAPGPHGGWVLVGASGSAIAPRPAAWASAGGTGWRRIGVEDAGGGPIERAVPFGRGSLLAAGGGTAWLVDAKDGESLDAVAEVCGQTVIAVTTVTAAPGATAVVAAGDALCASPDGVSWREIRPPGPVRALAGAGSVLLAAGDRGLWVVDVGTLAVR